MTKLYRIMANTLIRLLGGRTCSDSCSAAAMHVAGGETQPGSSPKFTRVKAILMTRLRKAMLSKMDNQC